MKRWPYLSTSTPADGTINVPVTQVISFDITTDAGGAASVPQASFNIWLDGLQIAAAGVQLIPATFQVVWTPAGSTTNVTISRVSGLWTADHVHRVRSTFTDSTGKAGSATFAFSTGATSIAVQIARQEPLLCPIDLIPSPFATSGADQNLEDHDDVFSSSTFDWLNAGVRSNDILRVESGAAKGSWIVRDVSIGSVRLHHTFVTAESNFRAAAFSRREFADRSLVSVVFNGQFPFRMMKVWGSTASRYWVGHASDSRFPVGFHAAPQHEIDDSISRHSVGTVSSGGLLDDEREPGTLQFDLVVNPIPTGGTFDRYSIPLNAALAPALIGTRVLTWFQVDELPIGASFFMGLGNTQGSPSGETTNVLGAEFVHSRQTGTIHMRSRVGASSLAVDLQLAPADFLAREWMVESELTEASTLTLTLHEDPGSGATVAANRTVTFAGAAAATVNRWTLTTFGSTDADLNHRVKGKVFYVDVEPGTGTIFQVGGDVSSGAAKARWARNEFGVVLSGAAGWKALSVAAALSSSFTGAVSDVIFLDADDTWVVIDSLEVQGGVTDDPLVPGGSRPTKFSLQPGFDDLVLRFRASHRGRWFVLANGDDPLVDQVLAEGDYDVENAVQVVSLDADVLGDQPDGPVVINVVVCKNPVPQGISTLVGKATLWAIATVDKSGTTLLACHATVSAVGNVFIEEEEDVIDPLSAQVDGVVSLFTTTVPYKPGKLQVFLDGVFQNDIAPGRVVETDPTTGKFTLSSVPPAGKRLTAVYPPA